MAFQKVGFHQFRNLSDGQVKLGTREVFLVGDNGQGKTNFLEALYLLSFGSSFRTKQDRDLVRHGKHEMGIHGVFNVSGESAGRISLKWVEGKKEIRVHDKIVNDRKKLLDGVPSIAFIHEDLFFVRGAPERRRWFMNQTLSLYDSEFVNILRRYRRLLKQRNELLKRREFGLLQHYDEQLAVIGLSLQERRFAVTEEFSPLVTRLFQKISGLTEPLRLSYRPSWGRGSEVSAVMRVLKEKRDVDSALGVTTTGPHRDRFLFILGEGREFVRSASTGQQRLLSLVLRVAQARFYSKITGLCPILLLDDVLLELDPGRRRAFREQLPEAEQIIYTFLPGEEIGRVGTDAVVYEVRQGEFHEKGFE